MSYYKVRLGDYISVLSGFAFDSRFFNTDQKGFPLIRIRDVGKNSTETFFDSTFKDEFVVNNGDILVSMDGEFRIAEWKGGRALLNQRVCWLRSRDSTVLDERYLLYCLPSKLKAIENSTSFVTVKHLSVKSINDIQIPLPDLPTQKHIASILDKADALRQQNRQLLNYYDELLQSTFIEMFGPKATNHKNWGLFSIEELANREKGSMRTGPFGSDLLHSEFVDDGIFVLGIDNVVNNTFEWNKMRFISPEKYEKLRRYTVKPGDLLISIMATIGRVAVVPFEIPLAINSKHLAAISLDRSIVNPNFIAFNLHSNPEVTKQITANGRGAIMDGLNLGLIRRITMRIPPLRSQIEFVKIQENIETQKKQVKKSLMESENIFESLLRNYFQCKN